MDDNTFCDIKDRVSRKLISAGGVRLRKVPAVYLIENIDNGKMYVGSTKNIAQRVNSHQQRLKTGQHTNKNLQAEYDSVTDPANLVVRVGYTPDVRSAREREQMILDEGMGTDVLLNINGTAIKIPDKSLPPRAGTAIEKMIETKNTPEYKAAASAQSKRNWENPEIRRKIITSIGDNVTVDGVFYGSVREASRETGVAIKTIRDRLTDGACTLNDVKKTSRRVSVRGIIYGTVTEAAVAAGVAANTMTYRLQNDAPLWSDHFYID